MKNSFLLILIAIVTIYGCSSSSNTASDGNSDSLGVGDTLAMRLISAQISFSDGDSSLTNYQYDERGNLVGATTGSSVVTYNVEPNGRIIDIVSTTDGNPAQATLIHFYDPVGGLRRIDNLASVDGGRVIGVSGFELYQFDGDLATSLESRIIPFEEIVPGGQVDDTAGFLFIKSRFEYDGDRIIRALVDSDGDGVEDRQRDYTYNSDGTLSSRMDTGTSTRTTVYSYELGACNLNWGNSTHRYFCVSIDDF